MKDYTPTAESIRSDYIRGTAADFIATEGKRCPCGSAHPVRSETARVALVWDREARAAAGPEFDRWLAEEIRKARAEALREFARNLNLEDIANEWAACSSDEHMDVAHWAAGNAASRVQMIAFDYADLEEAQ